MKAVPAIVALNRGVVSRFGLARTDVKRLAMAAQIQTNWMPRVLGAMSLRVGWKHVGSSASNAACRLLKFIFATDDTALLEVTDSAMRIWINDTLLTRAAVSTTVTDGTFLDPALPGWTDADEAGATSAWSANQLQLTGDGSARAIREQQVTVAAGDIGKEHGVRIVISRGPVYVRIGSSSGTDNYVTETVLRTGTHSFSVTPTGNFFVRLFSPLVRSVYVASCTIEPGGVVSIPTPWNASNLSNIRYDQSGDTMFLACNGYQQQRIERRGTRPGARSWSVVGYQCEDGPFNILNTTSVTITPSALVGDITLTASAPLFRTGHVDGLFSLTSQGQVVTRTASANGQATSSIRVTGVGDDRAFAIDISGDATASTVDLQRSYDNSTWKTIGTASTTWTADTTSTYNDTLNNQIVYYRLILTTRVAPDNVTMQLRIGSGSIRGIVRVTGYTNSTTVSAAVITSLGGTDPTADWQEGMWSHLTGWPTSVRLHEGRLWWAGLNGIWGSISDAYDSMDETFVGSAGPINRTVGSGPVDTINWLLSLKGMILGAQGAEWVVRASSLDEPLTPTNFNIKGGSTQGSGGVEAVKIDQSGCFVNRSGMRVYDLSFSLRDYDYTATDMMQLCPEIGQPGIVRMDVQRQPYTRLHCIRSDGTAVVAVTDRVEEVLAWVPITTDGVIEDVAVLPAIEGDTDDQVYYVVRRTINGATVRYIEKWAQESQCTGGALNCQADSYVSYSGAPTYTVTGLDHLNGKQVVVWADGADVGTIDTARPWTQRYTVTGGVITLATAASNVVVGLPYTAQFKSAKLGIVVDGGSPLSQQKKGFHIGLVLVDTHRKGLKFGPTLDDTGSLCMDDMPSVEDGTAVTSEVISDYDQNRIEFPGIWTTDMRVCLQAQAPRPCTVLAITLEEEQNT
jgi:hypothetical protein